MLYVKKWPVAAALFLLTFGSGCAAFGKAGPAAYQAPPLDVRDKSPCTDPGVGEEALTALAETRVALADCSEKHGNVVRQYEAVRAGLGKTEGR